MIRITVDSDKLGEGVSTIAVYLQKHLSDIFDNVTLNDPETDIHIQQELYRRGLQGMNPHIHIQAHPRLV